MNVWVGGTTVGGNGLSRVAIGIAIVAVFIVFSFAETVSIDRTVAMIGRWEGGARDSVRVLVRRADGAQGRGVQVGGAFIIIGVVVIVAVGAVAAVL